MQINCTHCQTAFRIRPEDLEFFNKVSPIVGAKKFELTAPTHCPDCRQQRRLAWRNERSLHWRNCDATGDRILSVFTEKAPYKVYKNEYWWSDKWDAKSYGRDFDFSRPFFEQFEALLKEVPQLALSKVGNENSEYVNQAGWNKNCYLVFEGDNNENCSYGVNIYESKSCLDQFMCTQNELCYDCLNVSKSYNVKGSINSDNCSDSAFLKDCIGSRNCFASVNLRNKEFMFFNEQLSQEEYEKKMSEIDLSSYEQYEKYRQKFLDHSKLYPVKFFNGYQNEDSTGNYLINTQRCHQSFEVRNSQDCAYLGYARNCNNVQDMNVWGGHGEGVAFSYEVHEVGVGIRNALFVDQAWEGVDNVLYSKLCANKVSNLFGCVGLQKSSYCILNKQYSPEEYAVLVEKIITHMKKTGEWGEFFPASMSPFGYNETIAQEYYPLSKEEVLAKGWKWTDEDSEVPQVDRIIPAAQLPDKTEDIPDDILNWAIVCEVSGKPFRINKPELTFYREQGLPIPRKSPEERHKQKITLKNPRKLWDRQCGNCTIHIQTSYSPDRSEKVLCEDCFHQAVE
jgi:Zn ribbon nucleic-acid-binding protein